MIKLLWSVLIYLKQTWRKLLIFQTLVLLNPTLVLRRTLWPRSRPKPRSDTTETAHAAAAATATAAHNSNSNSNHNHPPNTTTTTATTIMPPLIPTSQQGPDLPRIVVYFQTHHDPQSNPIPLLPLLQPGIRLTHLNIAAFHLNQHPPDAPRHRLVTLNDHHPSHPRFATLWAHAAHLQRAGGVKVLGMLGGAARGTFSAATLDSPDEAVFERYYGVLRDDVVRAHALDGLDLDVEEPMSLRGVVRLIDRLRADFGPAFLITLAPVAPALLDVRRNLSGFDYEALEVMRGREIAFYNCQFYCGWGDCSNPILYEMILLKGWRPEKVVVGLVTNPANGSGFVPFDILASVLPLMVGQHQRGFGGVMGWEYFNSLPGGRERPWMWAQWMTRVLGVDRLMAPEVVMPVGKIEPPPPPPPVDGDDKEDAVVPGEFEYFSDGIQGE